MRRSTLVRAAAAAVLALTAACAGAGSSAPAQPAAEPGEAPGEGAAVPGRLLQVAGEPEGLVISQLGVAVVAVRGPDALALVDLDSAEVRLVPTPSAARHLSLTAADGPVLVPLEGTDELLLVDPVDGQVVDRVVDLPRNPHDAVQHPDGTISVTDEFGGGMYFVQPGGDVVRLDSTRQPGGVAAVGDLAVMVDVVGQGVRVYDASKPEQVAAAQIGTGLTHIVALGDDRVAIADTDGDRVVVAAVRPGLEEVVELDVAGRPYGLAVDTDRKRLYVTRTERNELLVYDTAKLGPDSEPLAVIPTVQQANTVGVDPRNGNVVVAGRAQGVLQILTSADLGAG